MHTIIYSGLCIQTAAKKRCWSSTQRCCRHWSAMRDHKRAYQLSGATLELLWGGHHPHTLVRSHAVTSCWHACTRQPEARQRGDSQHTFEWLLHWRQRRVHTWDARETGRRKIRNAFRRNHFCDIWACRCWATCIAHSQTIVVRAAMRAGRRGGNDQLCNGLARAQD